MPIKAKLTDKELALIEVLQDPVWCAEFLRSTRDAMPNKEAWPKKPFQYRWYQRDILTDTNPRVLLKGGRAIGKCQPESVKVLTTEGYQTIRHLRLQKPHFIAYALTEDNRLVQSRAIILKDSQTEVYKVTLSNGYSTLATLNHPFLTPKGYATLELLQPGDDVAVITHAPFEGINRALRWEELRLFGYILLNKYWTLETTLKPRTKHIRAELYNIAQKFDLSVFENNDGILIKRKRGGIKNPITLLFEDLGKSWLQKRVSDYPYKRADGSTAGVERCMPDSIMLECNDNIQVLLEAVFAQHGTITRKAITLRCYTHKLAIQIQELLLRFGIESAINHDQCTIDNDRALYRFFTTFNLPGVAIENITEPAQTFDPSPFYKFVSIESIELHSPLLQTYAIYVYDHHTYIADNMIVHNSLVLEDKIIYETVNQHTEFPETKEQLLATANQSQIEPVLGRLIQRFTTSPLLKGFLENRVNRSLGVLEFRFNDIPYLLRARISGSKGENNMVGLHLPRMKIDEAQLFNIQAWTQLAPALNTWEQKIQVFVSGVPNGLRNSLLYHADKKMGGYKVYTVPAHNNPFYTREDDLDNIKRYGGIETDEYQQLVLGRHGKAAFSVLTRDQISQEPYDFYRYTYTNDHVSTGVPFTSVLDLPDLSEYTSLCVGIDTGYVDPTVIAVMGMTKSGKWRMVVRYVLRRVDFPMQEKIIHWLYRHYKFDKIGLDIGAGGGGTQILHSLLYRDEYKSIPYSDIVTPVQFNERVPVGYDTDGKELTVTTKTLGASLLVQQIQQHSLLFSEMDFEIVSEMERITKQRSVSGDDRYFILSEKGNGASDNDHNFAALICFCIATRDLSFQKRRRKKLGRTGGGY